MVVGGLLIKAARPAARRRRGRDRRLVRRHLPRLRRAARARLRVDERFEPYPGVGFDDETYRGDAYPAFGWAACVARVDVDLDTGEVHVRDVVAADDVGKVIHPVLAEGQVEGGTLQAVGYATIEEIKLRDGRYLNDRLATYIIPTALDAPRITTILVEAPFDGAPHGAKGVGELPMDVGAPGRRRGDRGCDRRLDRRPAGQPGADPRGRWRRARGGAAAARRLRAGAPADAPDDHLPLHGQRHAASRSTCPGMRRLLDVLREDLAPDRHEGGLRRGRVRRLHGAARRRAGRFVPRPGLPGRRRRRSRTVEGLAGAPTRATARLDALQPAFLEAGGAQCGICTPGMLMAARAYLDAGGGPDDDAIREAIAGNLCRCTGYTKIVEAIALAAGGPHG